MTAENLEQECRSRVLVLQRELQDRECIGAVILDASNIYYFSGFTQHSPIRPLAAIIPSRGEPVLVVPKIEAEYARRMSWVTDVRYYVEFPDRTAGESPYELVRDVLIEVCDFAPGARVGIGSGSVSSDIWSSLSGALVGAEVVELNDVLSIMRSVKSPFEADLLRAAGQMVDVQWQGALEMAAPGIYEDELAEAVRAIGTRFAAEHSTLDGDQLTSPMVDGIQILGAGERSSIPHVRAVHRKLAAGEVVMMCFCLVNSVRQYRVGFTRHFALGAPESDVLELWRSVVRAQDLALAEVRPGNRASAVDVAARLSLEEAGVVQFLTHRTGRGVGIDVAEAPELRSSDQTLLQEGMTFSVEPAIYIPGEIGFQVEDSVLVTADGFEPLTRSSRELAVL